MHYLLDHLTAPQGGEVQQAGMLFSNDGSYLRFNQSTSTLEFPDGHLQVFGDGISTIKDRFGNGLTITTTTDPQTCPGTVWVATDGFRTHRVCFRPTGYSGAYEQTEVIDHIDVAAFSGSTPSGTATYQFFYNDEDTAGFHEVRLSGFGTQIRGCNDPWQPPRVYLLTKLKLPDGTSYSMPSTQYTDINQYGTFEGVLKGMSLPTSGSIGWEYEVKVMPSPHSDENGL